jgi:hypothetical protein
MIAPSLTLRLQRIEHILFAIQEHFAHHFNTEQNNQKYEKTPTLIPATLQGYENITLPTYYCFNLRHGYNSRHSWGTGYSEPEDYDTG